MARDHKRCRYAMRSQEVLLCHEITRGVVMPRDHEVSLCHVLTVKLIV